jgi:serine protease
MQKTLIGLSILIALLGFDDTSFALGELRENKEVRLTKKEKNKNQEILVKFKSENPDDIKTKHKKYGTEILSENKSLRVQRVKAKSGIPAEEILKKYKSDPDVEYAEMNEEVAAHFAPNDPYYKYQWDLDDRLQPNPSGGLNGGGIGMEPAWDIATGLSSVIVAVVDTGVAYEVYGNFIKAPDLANVTFVPGYDFIENDTHPNDDNGHGTHVTGTIAQSTNNGIGVAGIAFKTAIMPVKVLSSSGSGSFQSVADGVTFAADHNAKVINLSLGSSSFSSTLQDAVAYAFSKGVVVVASAGNNSGAVSYPAAYDDFVIAVSATRYDEALAPYSNFGPQIDLAAPGGDSNVDQNSDGYGDGILQQTFQVDPKDFAYYFFQGTSMSAPHVSALVALLIQKGISSATEVRQILEKTAEDKGSAGRDDQFGYGIIDAKAALEEAVRRAGQIAYWSLDNQASDLTGHKHNGILNAVTFTNQTPATLFLNPYSATFDGASSFIEVPHAASLNAFPMSVATWIRTTQTAKHIGIFNKYVSNSYNGYQLYLADGNVYAWYFKDRNNYIWDGNRGLNGGTVSDGIWHQLTFTVDGSSGKLYVDGALKASKSWIGTAGAPTTTRPINIGRYPPTGFFSGRIDDVHLFNRAISASEVASFAKKSDTTSPQTPTGFAAAPADGRVDLSWNPNSENDLAGYFVSRSESQAGPFSRLTKAVITEAKYSDPSLTNGTSYWYKVSAADLNGNVSAPTAAINAVPRLLRLLGHWKLDNDATDSAGSNSGSVSGAIFVATVPPTQFTNPFSLSFDGVDDSLSIPHNASLNAFPISVSAWFKTTQATRYHGIINKYTSASYSGYQIYLADGNLYAWYFRDRANCVWDGARGLNAGIVNNGAWHHVVFTVDASGGKLFLNGVLKASRSWAGSAGATTTSQNLHFGRYPGSKFFNGLIDDVRIYARALAPSEISSLAAGN